MSAGATPIEKMHDPTWAVERLDRWLVADPWRMARTSRTMVGDGMVFAVSLDGRAPWDSGTGQSGDLAAAMNLAVDTALAHPGLALGDNWWRPPDGVWWGVIKITEDEVHLTGPGPCRSITTVPYGEFVDEWEFHSHSRMTEAMRCPFCARAGQRNEAKVWWCDDCGAETQIQVTGA